MTENRGPRDPPMGFEGLADLVSDGAAELARVEAAARKREQEEIWRRRGEEAEGARSGSGANAPSVTASPPSGQPAASAAPSGGFPWHLGFLGVVVALLAWGVGAAMSGTPSQSTRSAPATSTRSTRSQATPSTRSRPTRPTPSRPTRPTRPTRSPRIQSGSSATPSRPPQAAAPSGRSDGGSAASRGEDAWSEAMPPLSSGDLLTLGQLRYCLAESVRIDGASAALDETSQREIDGYNRAVDDYNRRCVDARYREAMMGPVSRAVDLRRSQLLLEGSARVMGWRGGGGTGRVDPKLASLLNEQPSSVPPEEAAKNPGVSPTVQAVGLPANARLNGVGNGWVCSRGYRRVQQGCVRINSSGSPASQRPSATWLSAGPPSWIAVLERQGDD
jgi:hypothetical protein